MNYFYNELIKSDTIFWFCALLGSGSFVIQLISNFFGMADQDDFNNDYANDAKHFKWLSIQAITGFLMMFGWTAITCQKEFGLDDGFTIIISFFAGLLAIFMISSIFKVAKRLQSTGNVYNLHDTVGKEALVYQRIPKEGVGKISISLQHLTHEIDAVSNSQEEIASFTRVQIVQKKDNQTVIVTPL